MTQATVFQPRKTTFQNPLLKVKKPTQNIKKYPDMVNNFLKPPDVSSLLEGFRDLPPQTAVIGLCDDSLPVLFDLTDYRTGPLIVMSDDQREMTRLLQWITQTAINLNKPEQVKFIPITSNPVLWESLVDQGRQSGHLLELGSLQNSIAPGEIILQLAEMAEIRLSKPLNEDEGSVLVLMDDLHFIVEEEPDIRMNFEWLCANGPLVRIWLLSSLPTNQALTMGRWVRYFKTRILGDMPDSAFARLGLHGCKVVGKLSSGIEYAVWIKENWLRFRLPLEKNN
jgi:hypothetical protein